MYTVKKFNIYIIGFLSGEKKENEAEAISEEIMTFQSLIFFKRPGLSKSDFKKKKHYTDSRGTG